jgi:zinc transport system ATP-binding protein
MSIVSISGVTINYGGIVAVENANFSIENGEYTCLIGANGSGKSTLIKGILGLLPINNGEITLGVDREKISYIPQVNHIERDFPATVKEVVISGTQKADKKLPFYNKQDRTAALAAMERLGISDLKNRKIGNLSGGQQQRVMLARALCREPKLLILDEPCSGLDPKITEEFYNILSHLNKDEGVSIFMTSHDLVEVSKYAGKVIVLNRKVEFAGSIENWKQYYSEREGK